MKRIKQTLDQQGNTPSFVFSPIFPSVVLTPNTNTTHTPPPPSTNTNTDTQSTQNNIRPKQSTDFQNNVDIESKDHKLPKEGHFLMTNVGMSIAQAVGS